MIRSLFILLFVLTPVAVAWGLTPEQEQFLRNRSALSTRAVEDLVRRTRPEALRATVDEIMALDNLSVGGRTTYREGDEGGGEGRGGGGAEIHRYLRQRIADTPGVVLLGELQGRVVAPVRLDNQLDVGREGEMRGEVRGEAGTLTVGGEDWPVTPLWPNGAMPALTPEGGLTGPLVWVDDGEWQDLNGLQLEGSIAVMSFRGGRNWVRLFSLGAQAVVVVEDRYVGRQNAERLFSTTPVPFPRFYASGDAAEAVKAAAMPGLTGADDIPQAGPEPEAKGRMSQGLVVSAPSPPAQDRLGETGRSSVTAPIATLRGGHVWEERPFRSAFAYLPPTAPATYSVRRDDLLERLAVSFGTSVGGVAAVQREFEG